MKWWWNQGQFASQVPSIQLLHAVGLRSWNELLPVPPGDTSSDQDRPWLPRSPSYPLVSHSLEMRHPQLFKTYVLIFSRKNAQSKKPTNSLSKSLHKNYRRIYIGVGNPMDFTSENDHAIQHLTIAACLRFARPGILQGVTPVGHPADASEA